MKPYRRRFRLLADWKLQGRCCLRICGYWLICQLVFVVTILGFLALTGPDEVAASGGVNAWTFIMPALVSSTFFLPMALLDNLRFTNKFAGPLMRFRRELKHLAEGEKASEIVFRPGDYLIGMDQHFNAVCSRLEYLEEINLHRLNEEANQSRGELTSAGCVD